MKKTTFAATCPRTGETRTRKSSHEYTHALTVVRTNVKQVVHGCEWVYFVREHQVPQGYTIISRCGSAMKGSAVKLEDVPASEQKTETISLVSFHASAALAVSAAQQYRRGGVYEIEAIPVPCTVV